jgi:hypothetical protein
MKANSNSRRFWVGATTILLTTVLAVFLLSEFIATDTSSVEIGACLSQKGDEACILFPTFSGQNLDGDEITFPDIFSTDYSLVITLFTRAQYEEIKPWLPVARDLADNHDQITYYGIALTPDIAPVARVASALGTKALLDNEFHPHVVMVFLENRDLFLEAVDIPNFDVSQFFIVNASGEVVWRITGNFTESKSTLLQEQVALLIGD